MQQDVTQITKPIIYAPSDPGEENICEGCQRAMV